MLQNCAQQVVFCTVVCFSVCVLFVNCEQFFKITAQDAIVGRKNNVTVNATQPIFNDFMDSNYNINNKNHSVNNTVENVNIVLKILHVLDRIDNSSSPSSSLLSPSFSGENQNETISSRAETRHFPSWFNIFKYDFHKRKHSSLNPSNDFNLNDKANSIITNGNNNNNINGNGHTTTNNNNNNKNTKNLFRPILSPVYQATDKTITKTTTKPVYFMTQSSESSNIDDIIRAFEALPQYEDSFKPIKKTSNFGKNRFKGTASFVGQRHRSGPVSSGAKDTFHKFKKYFDEPLLEDDDDKYNYSQEYSSTKKQRKTGLNHIDNLQRQPRCDKFTDDICIDDFEYPEHAILDEISKRKELFQLMFSEVKEDTSMVDGLPKDRDENFSLDYYYNNNEPDLDDYDEYSNIARPNKHHVEFSDQSDETSGMPGNDNVGFVCRSEVIYAKPKLGKNLNNKWRVIVNAGDFTQPIRMEKCSKPNSECRFIADNKYESRCAQVYSVHRLLVFEKNKGFFIDTFRIPTACSCHVQHLRAESKQIFNQTKLSDSEMTAGLLSHSQSEQNLHKNNRKNDIPDDVFLLSDETRKTLNEEILRLLPQISPFLTEKIVRQMLEDNSDMSQVNMNRKSLPTMFNDVKFALSTAAATTAATSTTNIFETLLQHQQQQQQQQQQRLNKQHNGTSVLPAVTDTNTTMNMIMFEHPTQLSSSSQTNSSFMTPPVLYESADAGTHMMSDGAATQSNTADDADHRSIIKSAPDAHFTDKNHSHRRQSSLNRTDSAQHPSKKINFSYHPILDYIVN